MRASCENGHEREPMHFDHAMQYYRCPRCPLLVTPEAIWDSTPAAYKPTGTVIGDFIQMLADYDIEGVLKANGRLEIEFPRPSLSASPGTSS